LIEIQNQIAALQKQAEEIKAQEFAKTLQEIQAKMEAFGITVADLEGGRGRARKSGGGRWRKVSQSGACQVSWSQRGKLEWPGSDAALACRPGCARPSQRDFCHHCLRQIQGY